MPLLWITLLLNLVISCVLGLPQKSVLHSQMNVEQLRKYFAVENHDDVPEYELVNIRVRRSNDVPSKRNQKGDGSPKLSIETNSLFGRTVQMQLRRNSGLLAPSFQVIQVDGKYESKSFTTNPTLCHYVGSNNSVVAALSDCGSNTARGLTGLLLFPDGAVQLQPVDQDLAEVLELSPPLDKRSDSTDEHVLHLALQTTKQKRLSVPEDDWDDERYIPSAPRSEYELDDDDIVRYLDFDDTNVGDENPRQKQRVFKRTHSLASKKDLFLELAIFFDQKGYELFMPHVKSEDGLVDLLLGFVNQMHALYQQPFLKRKIQISVVRMELLKKQPNDLPHAEGERDELLDSFCSYQAKKNPPSDSNPDHWDIGLYISGLNFYSMEKGKKNGITMGLAPVGGVCMKQHSCVIAEFGTVSDSGRPYPSAGLLSTYIAAHEIGHNLGMFHDGAPNNDCPTNGHVMSPSRGTKGETTWSRCSSEVLEKIDKSCLTDNPQKNGMEHSRYKGKPGQEWDAHDQCKVFLRDEDATLLNDTVISMVCEEILCKTPQRIGYYAAGPALEGTFCGGKKWCRHGECVSWGSEKLKVVRGGWSAWKKGQCKAGCLKKSRGITIDKRYCDNPKPKNTEKLCEGDNLRIHFCDDSKMCKKRQTTDEYAMKRCEYFSRYHSEITPLGVQVKHNDKRKWQACAVYCKTRTGTWYTPRQEFNDMGIDTFFPDGTWCHNDGRTDYYCQNRLCLPPPVKGRSALPGDRQPIGRDPEVDVPVLNNAHPKGENRAPKKLKEYFQYREGKAPPPLPRSDELGRRPKEEDYEIIDYVSPRDL